MSRRLVCAMLSIVGVLNGCALPQKIAALQGKTADARQMLDTQQRRFKQGLVDAEARRAAQDVAKPWLAGPAQPLAR